MKKNLLVLRYSKGIIGLTLLLLIATIIPLSQIRINADLESYMPESMESKVNNKIISEHFSNEEMLFLTVHSHDIVSTQTLNRLYQIQNSLVESPYFSRVYSLFQVKDIQSSDGMMVVNPLLDMIPQNDHERELLRNKIRNNPMAIGLVISENMQYSLIVLTRKKEADDAAMIAGVNQILAKYPGNETVLLSGQAVLRSEANEKISRDILILLPAGLIIMLLILWFSFKDIRLVLLPFSIVLLSTLIAMALIPTLGWELSLIGILIPIMMIAIANNYGIHFISGYQEIHRHNPSRSHQKVIQSLLRNLRKPVILCGLTTIVGVLGLLAHLFVPARQMGIVSGVAIAFALLLSLTFLPAVMSLLPRLSEQRLQTLEKNRFFDVWLKKMGKMTTQHPKRILVVFGLFITLVGMGIFRLSIAPDSNKVLPANHPFNQAIDIVNTHFGGSKQMNIMFEGDVTNPQLLIQIDSIATTLKKHPSIGNTTSLATMIRAMSRAMNDPGDVAYDNIPSSREAIAQYLELYAMSADIADFEHFLSFDYQHSLLHIQYTARSLTESSEIMQFIRETLTQTTTVPVTIGGMSLIDKEISESVKYGQIYSLLLAFVAIILLLSIIFKHYGAGLLGSVPLLFAVVCTFGFMGWVGIELNIVTALLSSISIGLGVDFSIHLFWRIRRESQFSTDIGQAIRKSIRGTGKGISINALSVMLGFSVLFISAFPFIHSFALLIILSLFFCLASALVLIPAICVIFKPSFINNSKKNISVHVS